MAHCTRFFLCVAEWRFEAEKAAKNGQGTIETRSTSHQSRLICPGKGSVGSVDGQRSFKASLRSRSGTLYKVFPLCGRMAF